MIRQAATGLAKSASILVLAAGASAQAQPWRADGGPGAAEGFRMPRAALSTQAEAPCRFGGHVVDEEFAQWRRYRRALRRHPDTPSCLREEARDEPAPDLLAAFDWQGLRTEADLEVCLFRVFASLGSIERAREWMAAAGLEPEPIRKKDAIPDAYTRLLQGSFSWEEARDLPALGGGFARLLGPCSSPASCSRSASSATGRSAMSTSPLRRSERGKPGRRRE